MTDTSLYRTQLQIVRMLKREGFGHRNAWIGSAIACTETPVEDAPTPMADFGMIGDLDLVNEKWGPSVGAFQVRSLNAEKGDGTYRDEDWLTNPRNNCKATRIIYMNDGWTAWSTFRSGRYKAFLQMPAFFPPPPNIYIALPGDNLSIIGEKLGVDWHDLARLNDLHDPYPVGIGDHIRYA